MGIFIKEILDTNTLNILTSNSEPSMIRHPVIALAVRDIVKKIKLLELYPEHQLMIDQYQHIQKKNSSSTDQRTFYTWQISQAGYELSSLVLPTADFFLANSLKCQASFISIRIDDICDLAHDKAAYEKCLRALNGEIQKDDSELYLWIQDVWLMIKKRIEKSPNYLVIKSLFEDAYEKWIISFDYSLSIQNNDANSFQKWEDHLETIAHSSMLYLAGMIDLLFVPNLTREQAFLASHIFLRTQKMVEIGNWATTWEREFIQRDFTSGVFIIAAQNNWITMDDLKNDTLEQIKNKLNNSPIINYLWSEWERLRVESHQILKQTPIPALDGYIESFSAIMFMQLASTGLM